MYTISTPCLPVMPDHINLVFLSATTPNMVDFSEWVGTTKRKNVYVISTTRRPVPLEHFAYAAGMLGRVMDASGNFNGAAAVAVSAAAKEARERGTVRQARQPKARQSKQPNRQALARKAAATAGVKKVATGGQHGVRGLVRTLASPEFDLLPVIVFSFSKRKCAECADRLGALDLLPDRRAKSAGEPCWCACITF